MKKLLLTISAISLLFLTATAWGQISVKPITKDSGKEIYRTQLGAENDEVIIGDEKSSTFKPQITFTKWDKENSLTLKVPDGLINSTTPTLSAGKVQIADSKTGFYFNPDPDNPDNFKFGLILYEKPTTNTWSFQIQDGGEFDYFYQGIIEGERLWDGEQWVIRHKDNLNRYRIESMNGSWWVRHKTKRNHEIGKANYMMGGFGDFYRPKFIDANGVGIFGDIDIKNGVYTVTIPQGFSDTAVYPVKANDTFGYTGTATDYETSNANDTTGNKFALAVDGDISKLTFYVGGVIGNWKGLIYNDDGASAKPNTLMGTGSVVASEVASGWKDSTFSTAVALTIGNWWLCGIGADNSGNAKLFAKNVTSLGYMHDDGSNNYTTPENPWTDHSFTPDTTYTACIYATYTPSGGGAAAIPVYISNIVDITGIMTVK